MKTVGIRELKNRLSVYVRAAEAGDVVLVTDRGRVVAELVPPGYEGRRDVLPGLLELERRGEIRLAARPRDPLLYRPLEPVDLGGLTSKDLIDWERGDG